MKSLSGRITEATGTVLFNEYIDKAVQTAGLSRKAVTKNVDSAVSKLMDRGEMSVAGLESLMVTAGATFPLVGDTKIRMVKERGDAKFVIDALLSTETSEDDGDIVKLKALTAELNELQEKLVAEHKDVVLGAKVKMERFVPILG